MEAHTNASASVNFILQRNNLRFPMLHSMTGYGRATQNHGDQTISVEIRSLNSKFTDLRMKLPNGFREKELELRRIITDRAERGKLEFTLELKSLRGEDGLSLNQTLFRRYHRELQGLCEELNIPQTDLLASIIRIPNVVSSDESEVDDTLWKAVLSVLEEAFTHFVAFRETEGASLEAELRLRIANISALLEQVDPLETERIERLRQRLRQNLEVHMNKENVDENRFEQELLFYIEKIDITEEKVRLDQHCIFFLEELGKKHAQKGRKLAFISQEIGREVNTLGAKAYSSELQRIVVAMKDELEKIKEQIANLV